MKEFEKCINSLILNNLVDVPLSSEVNINIDGAAYAYLEHRLNEPVVPTQRSNGSMEHSINEPPVDELTTALLNAARRLLSANGVSDRRIAAVLADMRTELDFFIMSFRHRDQFVAVTNRLASNDLHAIATLEARPGMPKRYFTITKTNHDKIVADTRDIINPMTYKIINGARYTCTGITAILPVRRPTQITALIDPRGDGILCDSSGREDIGSYRHFLNRYNTTNLSIVHRSSPRRLMVSDLARTRASIATVLRTPPSLRRTSRDSDASTQGIAHRLDVMDIARLSDSKRTRSNKKTLSLLKE